MPRELIDLPWSAAVTRFSEEVRERLATRSEYERSLRGLLAHPDCPVKRLDVCGAGSHQAFLSFVSSDHPTSAAPSTDKWTIELADTSWTVDAWASSGSTHTFFDRPQFRALLDCFWKSDLRDEKSRLISLQYPKTLELVKNRLRMVAVDRASVACMYVDLDHFKEVNDRLGHKQGDHVIRTWSRMAEELLGNDCIVLHRSGDEFLLLSPGATSTEAVAFATRLMARTAATDFDTSDVRIGCSVGLSICPPGTVPNFDDLAGSAELALVPANGGKQRGRVCCSPTSVGGASNAELDLGVRARQALCTMRADLASTDVFASPYLNGIAQLAFDAVRSQGNPSSVQAAVDGALRWYPMESTNDFSSSRAPLTDPYGVPVDRICPPDVAVAVARGVFAATLLQPPAKGHFDLLLRYSSPGDTVDLRKEPASTPIWAFNPSQTETAELPSLNLGTCLGLHRDPLPSSSSLRRACLVKVGHDSLTLLFSPLFAEVITVDDRPTRGGQLPDFWEATVARLVALLAAVPTLTFVYLLGDRRFARETVARLESAARWTSNLELMSYKTGLPAEQVAAASERLQTVQICSNEHELLSRFAEDLRSRPTVVSPKPAGRRPPQRFLDRRLDHETFALGPHDGIRVNTLAEAFPVVLELARHADAEAVVLDAAGQPVRELTDFKVVFKTPTLDRVPTFYQSEANSLATYLDRAFLDKDALFRAPIEADGQLDAVLDHVASAISQGKNFATRRAILVVPHRIEPRHDVSPLGLVSVRLIPRFVGERVVILYSFTWRTVEAFVGFPYSLYGSVGFAEHLTNALNGRLPDAREGHVRLGEVSYVAHSLHMFLDAYGQNIAKRIVDDASR